MKKTDSLLKTSQSPEAELPPKELGKFAYSIYLLLGAFGAFLGAQIIGPLSISFLLLLFGVKSTHIISLIDNNILMRFILIVVIEALTVLAVIVMLRRRGWNWSTIGLGRKPKWMDALTGLKAYGAYILLFLIIYRIEVATNLIDANQSQQLGFNGTHGVQLIFVLISLVILPPIAEEILFRGFIFMGLRKRLSFIQSALITSLLFGIAHLEFGGKASLNWAAAIDTFTLSCVLTYAAEKTKSLWPNMFVHAAKNLLAFVLLFVVK